MQKTIFIPLFQGVEAKNILRTGVVDMLLKNPSIRVVLFLKSKERADFYKKEFNHSRMVYEVVDMKASRGIDAIFAKLKFTLLRTETTNLRRQLRYEETGDFLVYAAGHTVNWLFARPTVRKIARFLDYHFVNDYTYAFYFKKYKPDLLFLAHLFDEREIHFLREAKRRNIRTVGFINSWDKVTARCIIRLLPDAMIAFNHLVKKELLRYDEMEPENIYVSGIPQYDGYYSFAPSSREVFFKKIGVDPKNRLIVFAPAGKSDSESDWRVIDMLHSFLEKKSWGESVALLVRFQPNDEIDEKELEKRPFIIFDRPGKRFSKRGSVDWDMDADDIQHLHDTLFHMDILVCYGSSLSIDAAVFDKPIVHIGFEANPESSPSKKTSRFYGMVHSKKAFSFGAARRAHTPDELRLFVDEYLNNPSRDWEKRARLIDEQCVYRDGKSAERIALYLLGILKKAF